jgi:acetyl-CoA carboxylase biotin carboxylase subunit
VFRKILIANRGEIAQRILRACRGLRIETVAIYSEGDHAGPWLDEADARVCVGPARAEGSYLNADAILQAAEQHDCQAIHPGYGFLAENAIFSARCEQQGVTFIGPGPGAIQRMGDKAEAKRTMAASGVPTIPGALDILPDAREAVRRAEEIGYPVILKATAGGGGRGMRRCEGRKDLERAFGEATLEAEKAFGNPGLYVEKYLEGGRHIELQILCDVFGDGIHLGERECSIQRHHQKLIEESPSPVVEPEMRSSLGERVARAVAGFGYVNAGTVEFLRAPDGRFYFMEMNTRLQVEHPVTEMITGVDIVEEQIRIAARCPLRLRQEEIRFDGHAIEFRINAEDPEAEFRPDPGEIASLDLPRGSKDGVSVRWDSAVRAGYRIPPHYDSMIGKLIVHAPDRPKALAGARDALDALRIGGVKTTRGLHRRIVDDPAFVRGEYDVNFLMRSGLLAMS